MYSIRELGTSVLFAWLTATAFAADPPNQPALSQSFPLDATNLSPGKSQGGHASCISGVVPVKANATNTKFNIQPPANQFAATELIQELLQNNSTVVTSNILGSGPVSGTYNISAVLCYPPNSGKTNTIQILTHGVGLEKGYWDISPGYSYVDAAVQAGYTTVTYDRLGSGESEKPDPIDVVQSTLEVEILHALIQLLKQGWKNVVCGSHSFGSIIQAGHDQKYPDDCAAVIATGISDSLQYLPDTQLSNNPAIANQADSQRFGSVSSGYLIDPTQISFQQPFFRYPHFNVQAFQTLYSQRSTYSLGELFTVPLVYNPAPAYKGPVDVVLGQFDYPFCLGDCSSPNRAGSYLKTFYPGAGGMREAYIVPDSGHVINAHDNAGKAFDQMLEFLKSNKL